MLTRDEEDVLHAMAEKIVFIPKGEKRGRWTREDRVALVYSVLCSLSRLGKKKNESKKS